MNKASDDSEKIGWRLWLIFSGVVILWIMSLILIPLLYCKIAERGQFGDSFGAVNALFSGLAFGGVICAILLQKRELKLQRKTLEATQVEIEGQKEQLAAQNQTLQHQNFESSFFQLLGLHSEIVNSMQIRGDKEYFGRQCFGYLLPELKSRLKMAINRNRSKTEVFNDTYEEEFFSRFQPSVGYYFRHLYNVVKFVHEHEFFDEKEFTEKKRYTNLIRAQLSSDELGLLFYNCLSDRGAKFKDLVEKYALFEDMPSEVLIDEVDEEHRKLYAPSAYGESG